MINIRGLIVVSFVCLAWASFALAKPGEQWAQNDPETSAWFARQKMPDNPRQSCCGEADAYHADQVEVTADGKVFAIVTDTRDDALLSRPHIAIGTRFEVPPWKNKDTRADPNPTGHSILFVGAGGVYCYLPNGGV